MWSKAVTHMLVLSGIGVCRATCDMPSMPSVTRADLYDFAHNMQNSALRAANSVPLTSSLERLVDAVSKVEPGASLTSAIEKASGWIQKMLTAAKDGRPQSGRSGRS